MNQSTNPSLSPKQASTSETNPPRIEAAESEISVVIPCLNEVETIGICVRKATETLERHRIRGEVIVADNGSTDGSIETARQLGARIVHVVEKG